MQVPYQGGQHSSKISWRTKKKYLLMRAANTSTKPALKIDWPNGENLNRKILGHFRPK